MSIHLVETPAESWDHLLYLVHLDDPPTLHINGAYVIPRDKELGATLHIRQTVKKAIQLSTTDKFTIKIYLTHAKLGSIRIPFVYQVARTMIREFPDAIDTCTLYEAPKFIYPIYTLLKSLLHPDIRSRIHLINRRSLT